MDWDELRRWLLSANWQLFKPDNWWTYDHMLNMKTGGIIPAPPNPILQRYARFIKHVRMSKAW